MLMLKKAVPFAWLAAGVGGFLLRRKQLMTIFDPETGFAEPGAGVSTVLLVLSVAVTVLAAVFAFMQKKEAEADCVKVFCFGKLPFAVYMLSGAAIAVAGILFVLARESLIDLIMGILAAISGIAVILFAWSMLQKKIIGGLASLFAVPTLVFCLWLAIIYKNNAGNPQIIEYSYEALGIAAAAVSMYFAEGYVCGRVRHRSAILSGLLTIYFLCVSIADFALLPEKLLAISIIAISVINIPYILSSQKTGAHE